MSAPRTMHIVGFVTRRRSLVTDYDGDPRNGVEVSQHDGPVHEVARDVLGVIEAQGNIVHSVSRTTSISGGWPHRIEAMVTLGPGKRRRGDRDMWHVFTEARHPWPRVWPLPDSAGSGSGS